MFLLTTLLIILETVIDCWTTTTVIKIGVILTSDESAPFSLQRVLPAIDLAITYANKNILSSQYELQMVYKDLAPQARRGQGAGLATDLHEDENVAAFFGPAIDKYLDGIARLAAYWKIPIFSGASENPDFSDNTQFGTLTRVSYNLNQISNVFAAVVKYFQWSVVAGIYSENDIYQKEIGKTIQETIAQLNVTYQVYPLRNYSYEEYKRVLANAKLEARVILLSLNMNHIREFMLAAKSLNLINSEWTYICFEPFESDYWGNSNWQRNDSQDGDAMIAYDSLLKISIYKAQDEKYAIFSNNMKTRYKEMNNGQPFTGDVNVYIGNFYDAVLIYGHVLNETLEAGENYIDIGTKIKTKTWNRTYSGVTGNFFIDEYGDKNEIFALMDLDPKLKNFRTVGIINYSDNIYKPLKNIKIHWPGNRQKPPPDTPACGFSGNDCPDNDNLKLKMVYLAVGICCIFCIGGVILIYFYRKKKFDLKNSVDTWKVCWTDIKFVYKEDRTTLNRTTSLKSSMTSVSSGKSKFIRDKASKIIANYRGNLIVVKRLGEAKIHIHNSLLLEVKEMQNIHCENLTLFIGLCLDPMNIAILTEYCPKGNLQDILQNDYIDLEWNFRMSLIYDLVKGLSYIHTSPINYHGHLRSSKCVIDSRFVLKLTGFGLRGLRECIDNKNPLKEGISKQKLLWRAPELLRNKNLPSNQNTDIYSFGIILQEIIQRSGPFEDDNTEYDPDGIIKRLIQLEMPPFRPAVNRSNCSEEIYKIMISSWTEEPENRPPISEVKSQMRKICKGHNVSILDQLLHQMEQYAQNLEKAVIEKTTQLLEEKKKSEVLLHQVLPPSVAVQLMNGTQVEPENFDVVTLYLSDIVSFTTISAESTPMQVIDLLNDLYTCFDAVLDRYDVYKVETIGDAYVVVSGAPNRNGNEHARQIAKMSLDVVDAVKNFKIHHKPDHQLKIRVGMHSGSVAAGVVGVKMPRYCLFGETVQIAAKMESSGMPLKIQVSSVCKELLDLFGFHLEPRMDIEIKGKGKIFTYWLLSETSGESVNCTNQN